MKFFSALFCYDLNSDRKIENKVRYSFAKRKKFFKHNATKFYNLSI